MKQGVKSNALNEFWAGGDNLEENGGKAICRIMQSPSFLWMFRREEFRERSDQHNVILLTASLLCTGLANSSAESHEVVIEHLWRISFVAIGIGHILLE